ncbi:MULTISPECIES: SDR family oxidoreductase [Rhodobacterales]|jgi:NAD(P)-dependent dehydrogenase (short-subunit alcohol dehydrogenase family)|uniref:SDR family oxidoreductase n=1 Tax=Rhodobacterales TaxID=204455 RepID=UPI00237F1955|nr:SDR family NAD(P)-dependent oxidoreductase [Phaeobacter gallaeciensis]MDE4139380.1 SDR family NAD(P)-dependent oxidoreductase [Phaeobacter gallaeciensis]MDE4147562.1 SDR family NAD(P)-dependent oxidoreductase [Phaeobacter gallaeciensis]MDE4151781.1 SDR family NAD(P)-dependent oxidoreductase [Phaeobacter gallaeciensis]MDE4227435.1 SDR family NAD(P)-dependent oxidoreductase [Phaeobacter gallaeciensis]MDE4256245.1 SDR family NAD(P)-dependent oxidoreductase [Phaeobacter gallaeciensis]
MQIKNSCVVVTGAAHGIGKGLAEKFAQMGAAHVICADIDLAGAEATAIEIGGTAKHVDVASEDSIAALVDCVETEIAPITLFCANAGILTRGGFEISNDDWQRIWDINVMSHVWTARHLVPRMLERGGGYILNTASAAGLLNQIGAAPYGVTKHAAVGFSEWLAITYGDQGIGVSVLCPQAVRSEMTRGLENSVASVDGLLEPEDVATACAEAIEAGKFLVLPHPKVESYMRAKTADYDRWITGMQKLRDRFDNT